MNRNTVSGALGAILASLLLLGCSSDNDDTVAEAAAATPPRTASVYGKISEALTNAPVTGSDLRVYMVRGSSIVTPNLLVTDAANDNAGQYAFDGIPINYDDRTAATYKIVIVKPGFQRFEAQFEIDGSDSANTVLNLLARNIYLYPVGTAAADYTYRVLSPTGKPVPSATVVLHPNVINNMKQNATTDGLIDLGPAETTLFPTGNLTPSLQGTTDAEGKVTFAGTSLSIGAKYTPTVLPVTFENQKLALTGGTEITIGTTVTTDSISLADIEFGADPTTSLAALYRSNQIAGVIAANNGQLDIVFNRPISLFNESAFTATIVTGCPSGCALDADSVIGTLSSDGLVLTLRANWLVLPNPTLDKNLQVAFTDATKGINISGYPAQTYSLFDDVVGVGSLALPPAVRVTAP